MSLNEEKETKRLMAMFGLSTTASSSTTTTNVAPVVYGDDDDDQVAPKAVDKKIRFKGEKEDDEDFQPNGRPRKRKLHDGDRVFNETNGRVQPNRRQKVARSSDDDDDDDDGGADDDEAQEVGQEEAEAEDSGAAAALVFRTDDKIDVAMNARISDYHEQEKSFVVSAIPVQVFSPREAIFVVCVAVVVVNDVKIQMANGERYDGSALHGCRPTLLQSLVAAEKYDEANALAARLSGIREAAKASVDFGPRTVHFEQMFVFIRSALVEKGVNSPAQASLRIDNFFSSLLQYQLRVRVLVDQLGSRQFPRFACFPGDKQLSRKAVRAYAAVALTNHEYARFCVGASNPVQRLCTSALSVPLNCAAAFELIDMVARPRVDFGLPKRLPLTSDEELEAEQHAQNVESDLRASIENNPFVSLENVTLGDIERSSSSSSSEGEGGDAGGGDADGSFEDLGDYDRNDSAAPMFDPGPPRRVALPPTSAGDGDDDDDEDEDALIEEREAALQEAMEAAAAERIRAERLQREAQARERREVSNKMQIAVQMLEDDRRERAKSLVGEQTRVGATRFTEDYQRCSPEAEATHVWRPMCLSGRGVRSLVPSRSLVCRPAILDSSHKTVGVQGGAGYDTISESTLFPLYRSSLVGIAMHTAQYNHEATVPHALKHFNEHGLRLTGQRGIAEPLESIAVCTSACLRSATNATSISIERQLAATQPINRKTVSLWMRSFVAPPRNGGNEKNATRKIRLRDFLMAHFRFEEVAMTARASACRAAGFETMEVARAARFRCFPPHTILALNVCGYPLLPEAFWAVLRVIGNECALLALAEGVLQHIWRLLVGPSPHAVLFRRTLLAIVLPIDITVHVPRAPPEVLNQNQPELVRAHERRVSMTFEECVGGAVRLVDHRPHVRRNFLVHRGARAPGCGTLLRNVLAHALPRLVWRDIEPSAYFNAGNATQLRIDMLTHNKHNIWAEFRHATRMATAALEIFIDLCDASDVRADRCVVARVDATGSVDDAFHERDMAFFYPAAAQCDLAATLLADGRIVFELADAYRQNGILRRLLASPTTSAFRRFGVDVVRVDTIEALDSAFVHALHSHVAQQPRRRFAIVVALDKLECERYKSMVRALNLDATVRVFLAFADIFKASDEYKHWLANDVRYEWNAATPAENKVLLFVPRADRFARALLVNVLNVLTSNVFVALRRMHEIDGRLTQREKDVFDAHNSGVPDGGGDEFVRRKLAECVARACVGDYAFLGGLALVKGSHFLLRDELGEPSVVEDLFFGAPLALHRTLDWSRANMFLRPTEVAAAAVSPLRAWCNYMLFERLERGAADSEGFSMMRLRTSFPQNAPFVQSLRVASASDMRDELERVVRHEMPITFVERNRSLHALYELTLADAHDYERGGEGGFVKNLWLLPAPDVRVDGVLANAAMLMGMRSEPSALTRLGVMHALKNNAVENTRLKFLSTNYNVRFIVCDSVPDNHFLATAPVMVTPSISAGALAAAAAERRAAAAAAEHGTASTSTTVDNDDYLLVESRAKLQIQRQAAAVAEAQQHARLDRRSTTTTAPPEAAEVDFSMDYETRAETRVTGANSRAHYVSWRDTMRAARDEATAGFGVGSWVALASAPPVSVVVLGSYEQSVRARFSARYVPPVLCQTAYERSLCEHNNVNWLGVFDCYFNGPMSALAFTLDLEAAPPPRPVQRSPIVGDSDDDVDDK